MTKRKEEHLLHCLFQVFYDFFFIHVILSQHCFQVGYTSLGNIALILSTTSLQSFEAIGCLQHSWHFSSQRSIIIYKFSWVHNLLWTYGLWTTLRALKLTFTLEPNHWEEGDLKLNPWEEAKLGASKRYPMKELNNISSIFFPLKSTICSFCIL